MEAMATCSRAACHWPRHQLQSGAESCGNKLILSGAKLRVRDLPALATPAHLCATCPDPLFKLPLEPRADDEKREPQHITHTDTHRPTFGDLEISRYR